MHVYDFNSHKPVSTYTGFNSDVTWVTFSYDESKVFAGTFGGTLFAYNYDRGKISNTFRGHLTHCRCIAGQKDDLGNYVVSGSADTNIKVWDMRQKSALATYKGHSKAIWAIDLSPDTQYVASGWTGGIVKLWDLSAGKWTNTINIRQTSASENMFIKSIKFNPADWCMAVAWSDKIVRYYDTTTYELINESLPDAHPICGIDFDPDGENVITSYSDAVKTWDLESRKLVSLVSKTARPTFDIKCAPETDFTFITENINGSMGLSSIATSVLLKKNQLEDYEEEKRLNGGVKNGAGAFDKAINQLSDDVLQNITALENEKPLDFYQLPSDKNKPLVGKIINNSDHDYVYGLEDSNDLDNYTPENSNRPQFAQVPTSVAANKGKSKITKQKSRKKVFCNNGKNMIQKPEERKKSGFGPPSSKPSLGSKVAIEGKGINGAMVNPSSKNAVSNVRKSNNGGVSLLTEEGLRKFEKELNLNVHENSTIKSEYTASLYEVPIDKPCGLNLEKFLKNVGNGITTTQTYGTMGAAPSIEVQRKLMEEIIKSNKTMLSVMNSRKIHLENVQTNWNWGDLSKTLNALVINKDTSAVMDFMNNTFVINDEASSDSIRSNVQNVKINNWGALLSHIYTLLDSRYETYLICGIKALKLVFQRVSEIISKAKDDIKHNKETAGEIKNEEK